LAGRGAAPHGHGAFLFAKLFLLRLFGQKKKRTYINGKLLVSVNSLFSLKQKPKEKSLAKKKGRKESRTLRSATKGAAFGYRKLLKKFDQNFEKC
jgi:hypothetical protein